ncbi:MAG: hypothetical protein COW55_00870 [Rhodobacteraceae bacterium CG17_big_fil_post_rev_8_21_14_2_50_65_11]|nr:MAG: hypothetical protein COW55_00870 [Rhodobacteraceae bacterium CG17_big_fil_post_rev_8_21_14_2_50_65_11]
MNSGLKPTPKVIALWQGQADGINPILARTQRYWSSLRQDAKPPARADLRADGLGDALRHAFLIDRVRPGALRFRLAGQHLSRLMGMDVRGMPLRAFFEIRDRKLLMEKAEQMFEDPATLLLQLVSDAQGRALLQGQMHLLPLRGASGLVDCALGVLATDGPVGLPPRRFRIRHAALSPLALRTTTRPPVETGMAEPATRHTGRPSLMVIAGGRD